MHTSLAWGLSFMVGGATMILELTASRLMAPILGNSLYTWTAVIGVVLAGLSLGAYIGGALIDRKPKVSVLRSLFFVSGGAVCFMMALSPVMPMVAFLPLSIPFLATLIAGLLFFVPALCLGAVQPMIVKLSTLEVEHLGRSYGALSALWSLGSIVGVFVSGFYLIPLLGTWKTFLLVAIILFASGYALSRMRAFPVFFLAIFLAPVWYFVPPTGEHVLFVKETGYFRALVAEASLEPFGLSRIFFLDLDTHSIKRGTSTSPVYTDMTRLFARTLATSSRTLTIGGGAYTMPNALAQTSAMVDVYELDPDIPPIVKEYFSLDPKIVTHIGDARHLLRSERAQYDIIMGDSFNSYLAVPWHLLTQEFNQELIPHLAEGGVYAVNIIATVEGEGSDLYESVDKTLRASFPFVEAYAFGGDAFQIQNIVFLASQKSLDAWVSLGKETRIIFNGGETFEHRRIVTRPIAGVLLTDDHAPTDTMLLPVARRALPSSIRLYYGMTN